MRLPRYALFAFTTLVSLAAAGAVHARTLLPHRAVYDLALEKANDDSDIQQLSGRWVFEFSGSACEGYTLKSRIVMRFEMTEGTSLVDQQVTSFEDAKSETFRFVTKSLVDQQLENEVRGTARLVESGTVVDYEEPEQKKVSFGQTLFPSAQVKELLDKAETGERFYQSAIFDGTEYTENAVMMSVVIGEPKPVATDDPERKALGPLASDRFRSVTAAYFDGERESGEETSDYNVSFKLHESGIQRDMLIHYDEYSMSATLVDLSLFEVDKDCAAEDGH